MMLYAASNARWFHHPTYGWFRNGEWLVLFQPRFNWLAHTWKKFTPTHYAPPRWDPPNTTPPK